MKTNLTAGLIRPVFLLLLLLVTFNVFSQSITVSNETFPNTFNSSFGTTNNSNGTFTGSIGSWTGSANANAAVAVIPAYYSPVTNAIKIVNWNTIGKTFGECAAASPTVNLSSYNCTSAMNLQFRLYTYTCNSADVNTFLHLEFSSNNGTSWTSVYSRSSSQIFNTWGANAITTINVPIDQSYRVPTFKYRFRGYKPGGQGNDFFVFIDDVKVLADPCPNNCTIGGVNLGALTNYLFVFTNGSTDANWQSASKGFVGNVAVDGIQASERTSGTFAYAGTIYTNDATLGAWQNIVNANSGQAFSSFGQTSLLSGLETDLNNVFTQINALPVSSGYNGIAPTALNGLNTTNGVAETFVINVNSGFGVSSQINITGDAGDIFILRWDTDMNFSNGYQGQVKFQSGGAIIPLGGLKPSNFIHVAGDINASGGGSTPPAPYPQGPRYNNGTGALITGGADFSGGGFFTGYWFTTGDPADGQTASLSNGIFVGGWYSTTNKFSMTSGTSGVYVSPVCTTTSTTGSIGDRVWLDADGDGIQDASETGGLTGITVQLKNNAGTVIATTTTNGTGNYLFSGLAAGTYRVAFPVSISGAIVTGQNVGANDDIDSDPSQSTGETGNIVLATGQNITNVDAGYCPTTLQLGNRVWNDANNNGINDSEAGIANATLYLYKDDNNDNVADGASIATTTTDADGYYSFNNLGPGNYIVGVVTPAGFTSSTINGGDPDNDINLDDNGQVTVGNETRGLAITLVAGTEPDGTNNNTNNNITYDFGFYNNTPVTGERCFVSPTVPGIVWAKSTWTTNPAAGTVTIRTTFSKTFVDNTYGTNAIGWPSGHTFGNLTGSDKLGWSIKDANGVVKLAFEQDYISSGAGFPSGYGTLGFGGDGGNPTVGLTTDVTSFLTSIDKNLNQNGPSYYTVTTNSPATDANYTPNATYPNWDFDVWYEVTVKLSAFGAAGFGYPDIATVHASPSKTGNNTEVVNPANCIGSLGDFVWHDLDGDGIQDAGEPGIQGVLVTLTRPDNTTATTTTNASGFYQFTNLSAGTYKVTFPTTLPGGFALTYQDQGSDDTKDSDPNQSTGIANNATVYPGQNNTTIDAGYVLANLTLGNKVFFDANRSGTFDAGDGPVAGTTVRLYQDLNNNNVADGPAIATTITDANGIYTFTNLAPGNYIVGAVIPATYAITVVNGGDPDNNTDNDNNATTQTGNEARGMAISLASGSEPSGGGNTNDTYDIGFYNPIAPPNGGESCFAGVNPLVYAKSYWTVNANAQTVTLRVTFAKTFVDNTYGTNAIGWPSGHTFGNLTGSDNLTWSIKDANGVEKLRFQQDYISADATAPSGYGCLGFGGDGNSPTVGLATDVLSFRTSIATNLNDYGYVLTTNSPATDVNYTPNPAQPNWIYEVWYEVTVKASVFGAVGFGFVDVASVHASPSKTGNNTEIITNNPCAAGSIGDRVWNDLDKDGIQDANEVGLSGVVVTLFDNATNTVLASTVTDAYGNYKFSNLQTTAAGVNYQVRFSLLPGYQFSPLNADAAGLTGANNSDANITTGRTGTITLTNAVPNVTYADAGMYYSVPARIGDYVWNDLDKDGIQEAGEPGIAGVTVMLYTSANVLYRSTVTSNNGYYSFNDLAPGTYYVKVAPPIGYQVSPKDATADNLDSDIDPITRQTPNFTVVAGTINLTIDAGLYVTPVTGASASLGDKVWEDLNNNNVQDPGEPGIASVTVQLYNSSNVLQATVTTDAFGNYIFNGLNPGSYYVKFTLPSGYSYVTANTGTDDTKDSDADVATGNSQTVTLVANEINTTVDAGMRRTTAGASLGDFVWYDLDKDGIQDGGSEAGVPGITVLLYNSSNVVVATTTTDINGFYLFTGLPAATTYTVGFENIPAGYGFSPNSGAVTVTNNSDVNPATGRTGNVTTGAAGTTITYVDAGLIITPNTFDSKGSIGDKVWNDLNNNGIQDAGEPGIAGVTVTLYAANGTTVLATTTTDALGNYLFTNLEAGSYVVGFSGLPAGYVFATKDAGSDDSKDSDADAGTGKTAPITLAPGEINLTIDAGARNTNTALSSLGNFVWFDLNNNGIQDAGEPGAEGVSVELTDMAGNVVKTTTTSATGEYLFTDLPANNYFIEFGNLPAGYSIGIKNAAGSTASNNSDVNIATGKTDVIILPVSTNDPNWDMGIVSTTRASLGDFVWNDVNINGRQDAGEPGVAGVLVTLYNSSNVAVASTVTDANGFYFFPNVLPGTYSAGFSNIPAASSFTIQNAGIATAATNSDADPATGRTATFTLVGGQSKTDVDAGLVSQKASVGNYVWFDANSNGIQDANEQGIAGVTVILYNGANQPIASAVTDANGYYFINNIPVPAGGANYTIGFSDIPTDYFFTTKNAAGSTPDNNSDANTGTGITDAFTLNPGQIRLDIDAGLGKVFGSIGDRVWNDVNRNGLQDAGELGLAGVTVSLYDNSNNLIGSTVTDAYGNYKFSNLPVSVSGINYQVRFSQPAGYVLTTQDADAAGVSGTNNSDANVTTGRTGNVTLTVAAPDVTYVDAGMYLTQPNRIGDFIWNDLNKDGDQDAGEPGIAGVVITLYDNAGNPVRTTITDNNGYYAFTDVPNGTYTLGVSTPPGYQLSPQDAGGDDTKDSDFSPVTNRTASFTFTGGTNLTFDGGLNVTAVTKASVGDFVWTDLDNDNVQDANEPGVPGVTVELYSSTNVLVSSTLTNALGYYVFNNLNPGSYYVRFSGLPAGYTLVTADAGADDTKDSDVSGANGAGTTATFTLVADQNNMTLDAGIRRTTALNSLGDFVWYDLNKNGVQDAGEAGVPGITVTLYDATSGAVLKTTTTNTQGLYMFTDLAAGSYTVGFSNLPAGYAFSPADATADAADSDPNPNTGRTGTITIAGTGNVITTVDAGIVSNPNTFDTKASIGDFVWNDLNNNGIQDTGEPGIPGVTVTLYAADGTTVLATTTTDALGYYQFTNLNAGTYVVGFSGFPAGYSLSTLPNAGADDSKDSDADPVTGKTGPVTLLPGQVNTTVDAALRNTVLLARLGNYVWNDVNGNGFQDAGEPGVPGVSVYLLDIGGNVIKNTTTDANGLYMFTDLAAGTYRVSFGNLPSGFAATTKDAAPANDNTDSDADPSTLTTDNIVLAAGAADMTWDLGIRSTTTASIGDFVWSDVNGNGQQDTGEPGIAGVLVTLYNSAGTSVASTVTDANGKYLFVNVTPGTYTVGFSGIPSSAAFTAKDNGADATDSDVNPGTGRTDAFTVAAGDNNTTIDAGLVTRYAAVGNYVWEDLDRNGIQDAGEPPVAGVTVILYNSANQPVASAVTDGNGYYFINNIPVPLGGANYTIGFSDVPTGYLFTTKNASGSTAENNSDVNTGTGITDAFTLNSGQIRLDIDAGIYKTINISGNVWHDVNALLDNLVNNSGALQTPPAQQIPNLYAYLVNANTGLVEQVVDVDPFNNTYSFTDVSANTNYLVIVTTAFQVIGGPAPTSILPSGWTNTGQQLGLSPGSDGLNDGILEISVGTTDVINANFGIRKRGSNIVTG